MKHTIETIKQKIRDCDLGKCQLVDVLVEVNETEKELREKLKFQSKYHVSDTYAMKIMKDLLGDKVKQNKLLGKL